jgi:hypothetical protein
MQAQNSAPEPPQFTRQSESESICMSCLSTVRTDRYTPLEVAEEIHSDVCLVKPISTSRYALL